MNKAKKTLAAHRERSRCQVLVRVTVAVQREDARLLRALAAALSDPVRGEDARRVLLQHFGPLLGAGMKALLVGAPLDGVTLDRSEDTGRDICL